MGVCLEGGEGGVVGETDGEELEEAVVGDAGEAVLADAELEVGAPAEDGKEKAVEVVFGGGGGDASRP